MGTSHPENKDDLITAIMAISPKTVLDVGAGAGRLAKMLFLYLPDIKIDAIEIWKPYVEHFKLQDTYRNVFVQDARDFEDFNYDLVMFGDVLEHMKKEDAISLWNKALKKAKYGIITIPIVHMPQEAVNGNPYEIHQEEDWSTEEILKSFDKIVTYKEFQYTGIFIAKFKE